MEIFSIIILLGLFVFCCYGLYLSLTKKSRDAKKIQELQEKASNEYEVAISPFINEMRENYNKLSNTLSIPVDAKTIDVETTVFGLPCKAIATAGLTEYYRNDFYIWFEGNNLFIFPTKDHLAEKHITYRTLTKDLASVIRPGDIRLYSINVNDIEYFVATGEEQSETRVGGGGSGKVNVSGAIIGGVVAGEAGAIIGGQRKTAPVYSYTQHFDKRFVELTYKENSSVRKLKLSYPSYQYLEEWMPEKEYSYVASHSSQNEQVADVDKFAEIKKYKELLDAGIITENEFEAKKKELLNI